MDKFWQDAENKWKAIQLMGLELMGKTDTIMPMLKGFVLEGNEVGQFPDLLAMFLYNHWHLLNTAYNYRRQLR